MWAGFAARTVREWLGLLAELSPEDDDADRTLLLAVLRGCLLDLLATGDVEPHQPRRAALPAPDRDDLRSVTTAGCARGRTGNERNLSVPFRDLDPVTAADRRGAPSPPT